MNNQEYSLDAEISDASMGRPHVVILGAGASKQAFPNGDRDSHGLPVMNDLVEVCGLKEILTAHGVEYRGENFEELYSNLYTDEANAALITELEDRIRSYFSDLSLPDEPTIFDHLVLGLRKKDVIATFNWDPFLWQAGTRCHAYADMPHFIFLHGNVAIGMCEEHKFMGHISSRCPKCGKSLSPVPLLYPIKKNYDESPYIEAAWRQLRSALKDAYILTIFGYGAPETDIKAVELMKRAWGESKIRSLRQTEIIDIMNEDGLLDKWRPFIPELHYDIHRDFYNSWIANHPRRSCEAVWNQTMECQFLCPNSIPQETDFPGLVNWLSPLIEAERK